MMQRFKINLKLYDYQALKKTKINWKFRIDDGSLLNRQCWLPGKQLRPNESTDEGHSLIRQIWIPEIQIQKKENFINYQ